MAQRRASRVNQPVLEVVILLFVCFGVLALAFIGGDA